MSLSIIIILVIVVIVLTVQLKKLRQEHELITKSAHHTRDKYHDDLSEIQRQQQLLIDVLGEAFFIVNSELEVQMANARASQILRNQPLVGRSLQDFLINKKLLQTLEHMVHEGKPSQQRIIFPSKSTALTSVEIDGETAWLVQTAPLPSSADSARTCIILRDITTEHRSDQIRTDFVTNASHELRTPLTIINGYIENLIESDLLECPETARKFLTIMRKHGSRLARLIDDMLMISRLESGESITLNPEPFDFKECLDDVIERLELPIRTSNANIIRQLPEGAIELDADRFYWTQVLFNLIENAIKQNPNRELEITVSVKLIDDNRLRVRVCDNGIGIPSSHLPFIFKRFYRVDKHHTQSDIRGTGLGLSIVKRALEAHNASIHATSTPGESTCFTIETPLHYHGRHTLAADSPRNLDITDPA